MTTVDKSTKLYSTFDPRYIPNCTLWLDAADSNTVFTTSGSVVTWADKSITGNNATSGGATSNYPTYTDTQNGKNVISFSGVLRQRLSLTVGLLPTGNSSFSVFLVGKTNSGSGNQYFLRYGGSTLTNAGEGYQIFNSSSQLYQNYYTVTTQSSDTTNIAGNYFVFSDVSIPSSNSVYRTGNAFSTTTSSSYNIGSVSAFIGGQTTTTNNLSGTIGEIIFYNRALTSTERIQVEGYLAWKWGLSTGLPGGHTYIARNPVLYPFNPKDDIANCGLWLDAADPNTVTGTTNVTQWKDKSGNLRNFTATTGPSYSSNTMSFNGTNQVLQNTAWNNFNVQTHTLIALHQPNANTAYKGNTRLFSIQQSSGTPYVVFPYLANTTPNGYIGDSNASLNPGAGKTILLDNSSTSAYNIITASIANGAQSVYNNGTLQGSAQTLTLTSGTVTSGVFIGNQYSEWYFGSVKEILIYTSALSVANVNRIEGYLAWKWGLQSNLPSTHPYKNFYPLTIV